MIGCNLWKKNMSLKISEFNLSKKDNHVNAKIEFEDFTNYIRKDIDILKINREITEGKRCPCCWATYACGCP